MKSQSAEVLPAMSQSRGQVVCRYNYKTVAIGGESDGAVAIEFDYVSIDAPVTKAALIDSIISDRYDKSAEIAMINNRGLSAQGEIEYAEYQDYRAQAKTWADEILF